MAATCATSPRASTVTYTPLQIAQSVQRPIFSSISAAGLRTGCEGEGSHGVLGSGCRVQGAGCLVQGSWCRVLGAGFLAQGLGAGLLSAVFVVQRFGFRRSAFARNPEP